MAGGCELVDRGSGNQPRLTVGTAMLLTTKPFLWHQKRFLHLLVMNMYLPR